MEEWNIIWTLLPHYYENEGKEKDGEGRSGKK